MPSSAPAPTARSSASSYVQRHVFESLPALRTTRPLVYEAVARLDAGLDAHVQVGPAEVAAARTPQQAADAAIQVYGAAGFGPDTRGRCGAADPRAGHARMLMGGLPAFR
ncbi:acyl-CoA dehydrogenase family protein [Streptomyces klenkii]